MALLSRWSRWHMKRMDNQKEAAEVLQVALAPFPKLLGIKILSVTPERVTAEMVVRADLCTEPAILHGGAIMAFADTLGAHATVPNLMGGAWTTTIESKTNFLAPAPVGSRVLGECTAIHRGKKTMVWQTRVTGENGRLLAIVTQTQMVLEPRT
jgi:1,4-dihydroxy-2-naphthoyl-CoA hydrolase